MKRESASVLVALCLAAAVVPFDASHAAAHGDNESRSYAVLAKWPDWGGGWSAFFGPFEAKQVLDKSLRPDARAEFNDIVRRYTAGELNLRELYCASYLFGGFSEGAEGDIEFLFTPDRVTLIWEGGLVRRIYLNSHAAAKDDPETGGSGVSTGHWEGSTLVVSTELNPNAGPILGYLNTRSFRVGDQARLTERIHLRGAKTLQIDMVLDAPALLASPVKLTILYRRDRDYRMGDYTRCPKQDRSIDRETGHLKQDYTPPADLPPPPD